MSAFYNASVAKWGEIAPKYRRSLPQSRIIGVKAVSNRSLEARRRRLGKLPLRRQSIAANRKNQQAHKIPQSTRSFGKRIAECKKAFAVSHREGFLFVRL